VRQWANERNQWGRPIGQHEAVAQKIADMAATTFAMESIVKLTTELANNKKLDLRLESAACKEWNTDKGWQILDDAMQIRGGRGYEMESSLKARGEVPHSFERAMRDFRINRIFEGSSEIMHLLMAREAVDKHLEVAVPSSTRTPRSRQAEGVAEDPFVLRVVVPDALGEPRLPAVRRVRPLRAPPAVHRSHGAAARAHELPRHDGLPGQARAEAALPLSASST
jgi:hypothetical protein